MLEPFGRELWLSDGPTLQFLGFPYPTRMAVARLADGGLFVWSPIAFDAELAAGVDALGPVRHLVAPNGLHHLYLAQWVGRYPQARLHAAPGLARKRRDLRFDTELGDAPDATWARDFDQVVFGGTFLWKEVVFFHRPSRTALVADLIQRLEPGSIGGPKELVMRLWGLVGEGGSTPREWRASFWNRRVARRALRRALAWDPERLVVAHGSCARSKGRKALERGLRWLL